MAYLQHDRAGAAVEEALLLGSRRGGGLHGTLGVRYWASAAIVGGTDLLALQEAGGWASLAQPRRYVERAKIANERVKLQM